MSRLDTPIRRRVRVQHRAGDEVTFVTKSFTKDDGTRYHPVINEATGEFFCDCLDHKHRKSFCKHLRRARSVLKRAASAAALSAGVADADAVAPTPTTTTTPTTAPVTQAASAASSPTLAPVVPVASFPSTVCSNSYFDQDPAMPRFFSNERIVQIIPAPHSLRAQFSDGCPDEPVLCLALLNVPAGTHSKSPYQMVMPMVAYHGTLELACDIDRPYRRLSCEGRN